VQCFESEVVNRLGTDQRGGGSSSAGVVDESGNLLRGVALRGHRHQDGPNSGWLTVGILLFSS